MAGAADRLAMPSVPSSSAMRRMTYWPVLSVSEAKEIGFL